MLLLLFIILLIIELTYIYNVQENFKSSRKTRTQEEIQSYILRDKELLKSEIWNLLQDKLLELNQRFYWESKKKYIHLCISCTGKWSMYVSWLRKIFISEESVNSKSTQELLFILAHEFWHSQQSWAKYTLKKSKVQSLRLFFQKSLRKWFLFKVIAALISRYSEFDADLFSIRQNKEIVIKDLFKNESNRFFWSHPTGATRRFVMLVSKRLFVL